MDMPPIFYRLSRLRSDVPGAGYLLDDEMTTFRRTIQTVVSRALILLGSVLFVEKSDALRNEGTSSVLSHPQRSCIAETTVSILYLTGSETIAICYCQT